MHIGKFLSRFGLFKTVTLKADGIDTEIPKRSDGKNDNERLQQTVLIGSNYVAGKDVHKIVLDIDHPAALYESTNGNSHLLVDLPLSTEQYKKLVTVMVEIGLVDQYHLTMFDEQKGTYVFAPWVNRSDYQTKSTRGDE